MDTSTIYTVGHSTHPLNYFLELLKAYSVNCLIDVRSLAASAYNPQYNKEPLSNFLNHNDITYLHFANEFGARQTEPELLDEDGRVDFEKVRKSWNFKSGVERVWAGIEKGFVIALMCSESDPFDCHRFSMVSIALEREGFKVMHILKDKSTKTNRQLEEQLLKKYEKKLPQPTIFEPDVTAEHQLNIAYRLRNKDIAFSPYANALTEKYD
jgi:uncharacterized protein (DUF488 family)